MITVIAVNLYLVVFTPYWPVTVLMLTWLAFDWKTPERGEGPGSAVATLEGTLPKLKVKSAPLAKEPGGQEELPPDTV